MTSTLWQELGCPIHGGLRHARVHESGHAVLATHFELAFERVEIFSNPFEHPYGDGFLAGGVFFLSKAERKKMTIADPRSMLLMCFAGGLAEELILGDTLEDSSRGDVYEWRRDIGMLNPTSPVRLVDTVGSSMEDGVNAARDLVAQNGAAIRAVAAALEDAGSSSLTYSNVCKIVANNRNH